MEKVTAAKTDPNVIVLELDAAFFFDRAVKSLDRLHYGKALKYFRRAVEYEPDNPVNHCNLAGVLSEMGRYEESNRVLRSILDHVDPEMTECYFYMANNYANMEDFAAAERAIVQYLENDPHGYYLEECEEMIELLSYELGRPVSVGAIKSREVWFEHDKARMLLEEGRFAEAVRILRQMIEKEPEFTAARNNLALAYYYMGQFDKAMQTIGEVLELEPGNLHALCNLAVFYHHFGDTAKLRPLLGFLRKLIPMHLDHQFKLATTLGILGEDEAAYFHFRKLLKSRLGEPEPSLCHFTAVAAYNTGRLEAARNYWRQAQKLDPESDVPRFYLNRLEESERLPAGCAEQRPRLSYHYQLPFEEQFRRLNRYKDGGIPEHMKRDPLLRSSFFWALRHGDLETKLHVIRTFALIADREVETALKDLLLDPQENDELKKIALFVLRGMGAKEPIDAVLDGRKTHVPPTPFSPNLPVWEKKWQAVLELALANMQKRYDLVEQYDLETLWVDFLTRTYPEVPTIGKAAGWAAALEYLTAKMHRRAISYTELAARYGVSAATVSKNVKTIDRVCGLQDKMAAIFAKFSGAAKE